MLWQGTFAVTIILHHPPEVDGVDLVSRLRADARTVALPVLCVAESPSAQLQALEGVGATYILSGSLAPEDLTQRVRFILQSDAERRALLARAGSSLRQTRILADQLNTLLVDIQRTCEASLRGKSTDVQAAIDASRRGIALTDQLRALSEPPSAQTGQSRKSVVIDPTQSPPRDTILVVEDNHAVRRMVSRVLTRGGYNVVDSESFTNAVALAEAHEDLSLLFTDINLQGSNGIQVATAVRKLIPDIPVLFTSGNSPHAIREQHFPQGRIGFIQKPFLPKSLIQKVKETIGTSPP
jgi:CheY-like chemotaxis protein